MKVAFAGTPAFARASLDALIAAGHEVVLVLTQPDRPAGRGMRLQASPVKQAALAHRLPICQPRSLKLDGRFAEDAQAARQALQQAAPEVIVVAAYGLMLPPWTLRLPRHGCLNVHASLLPRWRGAAPIHRAIEAGDRETGITIMQMDDGLDTGAMLLAESIPIALDAATATLHDELAALGARLIVRALHDLAEGGLQPLAQPEDGITYARKVDKAEALADWSRPAPELERRMRAFDPFPGLGTTVDGEPLKLWRAAVVPAAAPPGTVLAAGAAGLLVACGEGGLLVTELQRAGGRRQPAAAFLQARPVAPGTVLGAAD